MKQYAKKLIDTAMLAGQIMLENNAETYRVEETMNYILATSKFETYEAYAMVTGIFATLDDDCIDSLTEIRRIRHRGTNLNKVYKVNTISRHLVQGDIDLDTAYTQLRTLRNSEYSAQLKNLCLILMCGFYAALYSGGIKEMLVAWTSAIMMPLFLHFQRKIGMRDFTGNVIVISALVFVIVNIRNHFIPDLKMEIAIIGAMMPLVPGTAITNAIRDTLRGDYNSGVARTLEAFVIALSVAFGVALGLLLSGGASSL